MEKILLAIDAINLDNTSLKFACYLAGLTNSKITGVFLENLLAEEGPLVNKMQEMNYGDWEADERPV